MIFTLNFSHYGDRMQGVAASRCYTVARVYALHPDDALEYADDFVDYKFVPRWTKDSGRNFFDAMPKRNQHRNVRRYQLL